MAQKKSGAVRNMVLLIAGLFIISWAAALVFSVRYAAARAECGALKIKYDNMKEVFGIVERQVASLEKEAERLASGAEDKRELAAANFLEWKYLLQDQVALANKELSDRINKAAGQKADKELLNLLYYNLGLGNTLAGNFDLSIAAFEEAVKYDPRDAGSYYNLGLLYSAYKGNKAKAVNCYKNHLAFAPKASNADEVKDRIRALGE